MIVISPRVQGALFCIVGILYSWGYGYDQENPGPQCFHYEVFEHPNTEPGDQAPNRALSHYPHETIHERTGEIPELTEENEFPVQISLGYTLPGEDQPPHLWQHDFTRLGEPLTVEEASRMVLERQALGIKVEFQRLDLIRQAAQSAPLSEEESDYVQSALNGGGYFASMATAIYRLRYNNLQDRFFGALDGLPNDSVLLHFHLEKRVSKNLKELSHNSLPHMDFIEDSEEDDTQESAFSDEEEEDYESQESESLYEEDPEIEEESEGPEFFYFSIKDIMDLPYRNAGIPTPHSASIVSSEFLQPY